MTASSLGSQTKPRPRLVKTAPRLGDLLQRLILIAPEDVRALERLTRDVLRRAEDRHRRAFQGRPDPTKAALWLLGFCALLT